MFSYDELQMLRLGATSMGATSLFETKMAIVLMVPSCLNNAKKSFAYASVFCPTRKT